jgi:hypothetical protein
VAALGIVLVAAAAAVVVMGARRKRSLLVDAHVTAPPSWMTATVTAAALAACLTGLGGIVAAVR